MPIYKYVCQQCGTRSEVMQKVSEPAPATCPSCGAAGPLERVVSRTSFQHKGGGWYADLYGSSKKDSGKSESKPAAPAKTETKSDKGGSST
jgi:putative FmdB family regulatory protein